MLLLPPGLPGGPAAGSVPPDPFYSPAGLLKTHRNTPPRLHQKFMESGTEKVYKRPGSLQYRLELQAHIEKRRFFCPHAAMDDPILSLALDLLRSPAGSAPELPESGLRDAETLRRLAPHVLARAANLGGRTTLAHMDPPTPEITWATALWNACRNQNLLHPATSPFASKAERLCISWLAPFFGMTGGHFCAGSTIGNLTGLWTARNHKGVKTVFASELAHNSIAKSCDILGLELRLLPADDRMRLIPPKEELAGSCLVLTAGTTGGGAIDPLRERHGAAWVHVDAAQPGAFGPARRHRERGSRRACFPRCITGRSCGSGPCRPTRRRTFRKSLPCWMEYAPSGFPDRAGNHAMRLTEILYGNDDSVAPLDTRR